MGVMLRLKNSRGWTNHGATDPSSNGVALHWAFLLSLTFDDRVDTSAGRRRVS